MTPLWQMMPVLPWKREQMMNECCKACDWARPWKYKSNDGVGGGVPEE
jgi:hypothetical protein